MSILIFSLFFLIYLVLSFKSERTYPILFLFAFIYFIQYILSTYLIYTEYGKWNIPMAINQDEYFVYAIPALTALFLGIFLFSKDVDITDALNRIDERQAAKYGYLLVGISFFFDGTQIIGLGFLKSVVSFTYYLKFLGAFCFLFSNSRFNYFLCALIYLQFVFIILRGGVFIDLIIWATFLFYFIALKFKFHFWLRSSFIVIALPLLITIQTVKEEYRKITWKSNNESGSGIELFSDLVKKNNALDDAGPLSQSEGVIKTISRLSEGWHLGRVLHHIPRNVPFANGDEMFSDVISSLLPRILFPDKKVVNTQDKFYKYTGWKLHGGTTMSVGLLGDFYLNFGTVGSFIMLFLFGAILSKFLYYFIVRYVVPDPINIIWVPFILSYLIRADNDFYIVFNCLVKGFLIFLIVNFIRKDLTKLSVQ